MPAIAALLLFIIPAVCLFYLQQLLGWLWDCNEAVGGLKARFLQERVDYARIIIGLIPDKLVRGRQRTQTGLDTSKVVIHEIYEGNQVREVLLHVIYLC